MGIDFLTSIVTLVIAYGVQHSWLKQATKADEATLALARLLCAAQEYHRTVLQLLAGHGAQSGTENTPTPLVFGQDAADKVRHAPAIRDFFADQRLYDHIAVARFGIDDGTIRSLAAELSRSIGATRVQLNDRNATPAQIFHEAKTQEGRCDTLGEQVVEAIEVARHNASFLRYLQRLLLRAVPFRSGQKR